MTPENQALLEAFRGMINEAITPLATRMEGLETRMEGLETRMEGLETRVETIDVRTSQMSNDLLDLRDRVPLLEERVDNGFRALKSDLNFAFSDPLVHRQWGPAPLHLLAMLVGTALVAYLPAHLLLRRLLRGTPHA